VAELSWRELDIQRAVMARLDADREGYLDLYDVEFGGSREYSADNAAELFPEYSEWPETRTLNREAVGRAASWIAYTAFLRRLDEPGNEIVVMTGGGTGSGKSTTVRNFTAKGCLVYDSTLTSVEGCSRIIDYALAAGRRILIVFTWREPVDAFIGMMKRANSADGRGRVVQLSTHISSHRKAVDTVLVLNEQYQGNPRVAFGFQHNLGKDGEFRPATIDLVKKADYTGVEEVLKFALEAAYSTSKISEVQYRRILGLDV
jgi:hypothetical protein